MKKISIFEKILFILLIVASFTLDAIKGFSKLSIGLAFIFLFFIFLRTRKVFFVKEFFFPFIFLIFNMFSLFWGGDFNFVMQVSSAIIIGYVVFVGLKFEMPIVVLLWALAIAAILNIVFSYQNILFYQGNEADRVAGLVDNANALAMLLSFVAFLLYFLAPKRNYLIKGAVFYFLFFAVFYTGSRKGLLLAGIIILFFGIDYLLLQKKKISPQRFFFVFLILGIFLLFCFKKFSETSQSIVAVQRTEMLMAGTDNWSALERYSMIQKGLELWEKRPIWGWGGGGFALQSGFDTYSHNNYVELLTNYGLIGFLLYYSFYGLLFIQGWKLRREYLPRIGFLIVFMFLILEFGFVSLGFKSPWIFLGIAAYCIYGKCREVHV